MTAFTQPCREWQQIREDLWVFGVKIRGIVRDHEAVVTMSETSGTKWWTWLVGCKHGSRVGRSPKDAIIEAEQEMTRLPEREQ